MEMQGNLILCLHGPTVGRYEPAELSFMNPFGLLCGLRRMELQHRGGGSRSAVQDTKHVLFCAVW